MHYYWLVSYKKNWNIWYMLLLVVQLKLAHHLFISVVPLIIVLFRVAQSYSLSILFLFFDFSLSFPWMNRTPVLCTLHPRCSVFPPKLVVAETECFLTSAAGVAVSSILGCRLRTLDGAQGGGTLIVSIPSRFFSIWSCCMCVLFWSPSIGFVCAEIFMVWAEIKGGLCVGF